MATGPMSIRTIQHNGAAFGGGPHTVQFGFPQAMQPPRPHGAERAQEAALRSRSLLSELLLKEEAVQMALDCASSQPSDSDGEEAMSHDFEEEDWTWFEGASNVHSTDCSSSQASAPIPIPAVCYFKDDVQRQALEKLNKKRQWYQQQLEAERMVARSMSKSRQGAAAAKNNKPTGRPGAPV